MKRQQLKSVVILLVFCFSSISAGIVLGMSCHDLRDICISGKERGSSEYQTCQTEYSSCMANEAEAREDGCQDTRSFCTSQCDTDAVLYDYSSAEKRDCRENCDSDFNACMGRRP